LIKGQCRHLKYQGETTLDHQYALKNDEAQEDKIGLLGGWVSVGGGRKGWMSVTMMDVCCIHVWK
jgi:hypothetical protein